MNLYFYSSSSSYGTGLSQCVENSFASSTAKA